jgi:hypothetical protein
MMQAMTRKRKTTLFNKAHEFATKCNAHVYLLVKYGQRYHCYTSLDHPAWPPPPSQVVSINGNLSERVFKPGQAKSYPLPELMDAKTFMPKHSPSPSSSSSVEELPEERQPLLHESNLRNSTKSVLHDKPLPNPRVHAYESLLDPTTSSIAKTWLDPNKSAGVDKSNASLSPLFEDSEEGEIPCILVS